MRFIYLIPLTLLIFSCSPDAPDETENRYHREALAETSVHPASNALNPYEYSGQLFDSLFDAYYDTPNLPVSTADVIARVNQIADQNSQFISLKTAAYAGPSFQGVTNILSNPNGCAAAFIENSSLSAKGKTGLSDFINHVVPLCNAASDYQTVHDYVIAFEDATLNSVSLTAKDKEVMLITSSISRYSAYRQRKKPKKKEDPEWDLLVTHVTAGAEGAELGVCESASRALATGVVGQN